MKQRARAHVQLEDLVRLEHLARGITFLPKQPVQSLLSGRHASRLRGRGLTFEELRQYRAGDDIRTMDWRATARLRKPYVKVHSEERDRPILLLVDQRTPMFFGSRVATKAVIAAEAASIVAWSALRAGDRVGAMILGDDDCVEIEPQRSRGTVLRILGEITRMNQRLPGPSSVRSTESMQRALVRVPRLLPHDGLLVGLSGFQGLEAEVAKPLTTIARHNDVLVALAYDPLEAILPAEPGMMASDGSELVEVPAGRRFDDAYQESAGRLVLQLRADLRRLRIPVVPLTTAEPVIDQLNELFGRRARRQLTRDEG